MATILNRQVTFATNGTVTAAGLHNLIDQTEIYAGIITTQDQIASVGSSDQLLIADADETSTSAPRRVTVGSMFNDALNNGIYTTGSFTNKVTAGSFVGNLNGNVTGTIVGTSGTLAGFNSTTGTIVGFNSTTGTIVTGTVSTLNSTTGTIATLNSTTGTITNLSATTSTFLGAITGSTNAINIGSGQVYKETNGKVYINSATQKTTNLALCKVQVYDSSIGLASNTDYTPQVFLLSAGTTVGAAGYFIAARSRGSYETPAAIQANDFVGNLSFSGYDGTTFYSNAAISGYADAAVTTGTVPLALQFSTGSAAGLARMVITSTGNVGIGTTSPASPLHVRGNSVFGTINVQSLSTNAEASISFYDSADTNADKWVIGKNINVTADQFCFYKNGIQAVFDTNGNFGIGVSAPVNSLEVVGSFGRGAPVTKTADFTLAATENWIIVNKAAVTCTVTLPAASSWTGREFTIKTLQAFTVVSASSNVVPINGTAAGTAILPATSGSWATLVSNGTAWVIMAS
jgi:hypothetical protein